MNLGKKFKVTEAADGTLSITTGSVADAGVVDIVMGAIPGMGDHLTGTAKLLASGLGIAAGVLLTSKYTTGNYIPSKAPAL